MAGPQPDLLDAMQGWLKRHKVFDSLTQVRDKMEALEAQRVASPHWKKFKVEYDRKMPLMLSELDMAPASKEAQKAHDTLAQVLFHGRNTGGDDLALQAARSMDYATAHARMVTAWKYAKELQREQAAVSAEPSFAATLGTALEESAFDRGAVMRNLQLAVEVAKAFVAVPDRIRLLNKLVHELGLPSVPAEIVAVSELVEDVANGAKAIGYLTELGAATVEVPIGTAAAGILATGIIAGICLETLSVIMDLLTWAAGQKEQPGFKALNNMVSTAKSIADALQPIISKTGPLVEFGKLIRKAVHKK